MTPNFLINNLVIKYKLMNIFMSDYLLDSFVTVGIHYEFFFFSSLFLLVFEQDTCIWCKTEKYIKNVYSEKCHSHLHIHVDNLCHQFLVYLPCVSFSKNSKHVCAYVYYGYSFFLMQKIAQYIHLLFFHNNSIHRDLVLLVSAEYSLM